MIRLASSLGLLALFATRSAVACPYQPLVEEPLTPTGATLYGDGGVLMTTRPGGFGGGVMPSGPLFRANDDVVEVDNEYIAPALSMVRPKQVSIGTLVSARTLELVDAKGNVLRTYEQRMGGKRLAAPKGRVSSTLTRAAAAVRRGPYPPQGSMTITLAQDPPADAAVIVMQLPRDKTGIAWAPVTAGQRAYAFGPAGKGCTPGPATARQGDRVVLVWFDVHGQKSGTSAVLTVGVAKR
jgi:hypothetical protein